MSPPCAGVVVFRLSGPAVECALVQADHGGWGFPKGKRNRNESVVDNALRELHEETGLARAQISFLTGEIDERSDRGNLAVRYLVARLVDLEAVLVAAPEEQAVGWFTVEEARVRLGKRRREVLTRALAILDAE
ncbi:MAG: NUDIX domain-containing protein [Nannocystaceae bacterium]